jgi:hypothetical protein
MYAGILAEPRYVAVFFVVVWTGLFAALRRPASNVEERLGCVAAGVLCAALLASLSISVARQVREARSSSDAHLELSDRLRSYGVRQGDRVARIGGLFAASWARLLRVTVVAEIPNSDTQLFWSADESSREELLRYLRDLGVRAVVAERVGSSAPLATGANWLNGGTDRFAFVVFQ